MTKEFAVRSGSIAVEVYMADGNPPVLYDFHVSRAGEIRRTPVSAGIPGIIQVVMEGASPTPSQIIHVRRQFELDGRFQLLNFY